MELDASTFKYFLLFALIIGWFYFRMMRALRRGKKSHGRQLWRERLQERRRSQIDGAETWSERRARRDAVQPPRTIHPRFLPQGEDATEGDAAGSEEPSSEE
jgi:hypothetical protein